MFPKNQSDVEYPGIAKHSGTRNDGRNLVEEWIKKVNDKVSFASLYLSLVFHCSQLNLHILEFKVNVLLTFTPSCTFCAERPLCLEQEATFVTESKQCGLLIG